MHPWYTDSSSLHSKNGRKAGWEAIKSGQLCKMYCCTFDNRGSLLDSTWICLAVLGESLRCWHSNTISGGGYWISGWTGRGNRDRASALAWAVVRRKVKQYSNCDRYKDHLWIRADAWGEVDLHSLNKPNNGLTCGLWSVGMSDRRGKNRNVWPHKRAPPFQVESSFVQQHWVCGKHTQ